MGSCDQFDMAARPNLGPLEEQRTLVTIEPSLQHIVLFIKLLDFKHCCSAPVLWFKMLSFFRAPGSAVSFTEPALGSPT